MMKMYFLIKRRLECVIESSILPFYALVQTLSIKPDFKIFDIMISLDPYSLWLLIMAVLFVYKCRHVELVQAQLVI